MHRCVSVNAHATSALPQERGVMQVRASRGTARGSRGVRETFAEWSRRWSQGQVWLRGGTRGHTPISQSRWRLSSRRDAPLCCTWRTRHRRPSTRDGRDAVRAGRGRAQGSLGGARDVYRMVAPVVLRRALRRQVRLHGVARRHTPIPQNSWRCSSRRDAPLCCL